MKGWDVVVEAAAKLAFRGQENFLSTGRSDFGLQATLQRFSDHHAWYVSASGVYYDGSTNMTPTGAQIVPTLIVGYERKLSPKTHLVLQGYVSNSVYSHEDTDLQELLDTKYQLSIGVYRRFNRGVFSFAFTENLQNFNNTPDVALQLGWAFSPALATRLNAPRRQAGWTFAFRRKRFIGSYFFLTWRIRPSCPGSLRRPRVAPRRWSRSCSNRSYSARARTRNLSGTPCAAWRRLRVSR